MVGLPSARSVCSTRPLKFSIHDATIHQSCRDNAFTWARLRGAQHVRRRASWSCPAVFTYFIVPLSLVVFNCHVSPTMIALFLLFATALAQQCYYPSGTQTDSSTVPCNNTATGFVHCCAVGDTCISNGFCFGAAQAMVSTQQMPPKKESHKDKDIN